MELLEFDGEIEGVAVSAHKGGLFDRQALPQTSAGELHAPFDDATARRVPEHVAEELVDFCDGAARHGGETGGGERFREVFVDEFGDGGGFRRISCEKKRFAA